MLYTTVNKVMGRQFFKNCFGLSCFRIQVIIPNLFVEDSSPISYDLLIALITKYFKSGQKKTKNTQQ